MKGFKINQTDLNRVVSFCARGVSSNPILPAHEMLVIRIRGGVLHIKGYNHKFGVYDSVNVESGDDMDIATHGHAFARLLSTLSGELSFQFDAVRSILKIKTFSGKYELFAEEPMQYPVQDTRNAQLVCRIPSVELKDVIRKCSIGVRPDELRPMLGTLYMSVTDERREAVGANMQFLALRENIEITDQSSEHGVQIMPDVYQCLQSMTGNVSISQNDPFSVFEDESGRKVVQQKSFGVYPNYRMLIPSDHEYETEVPKESLENALFRVMTMTRVSPICVLTFQSDGRLMISSEDVDFNTSGKEYISGTTPGDFSVAVNGNLLLNLLKSRFCDTLQIKIKSPQHPLVIEGSDKTLSLLMPFVC